MIRTKNRQPSKDETYSLHCQVQSTSGSQSFRLSQAAYQVVPTASWFALWIKAGKVVQIASLGLEAPGQHPTSSVQIGLFLRSRYRQHLRFLHQIRKHLPLMHKHHNHHTRRCRNKHPDHERQLPARGKTLKNQSEFNPPRIEMNSRIIPYLSTLTACPCLQLFSDLRERS